MQDIAKKSASKDVAIAKDPAKLAQTAAAKAALRENVKESIMKVYEIGYLLVSSIPEEKVADEVAALKDLIMKKGATMIAEEAPELRTLAFMMLKKVGAINERYTEGYFGWVKFELSSSEIESVKKAFEENPHMLRTLVMTTIRENTYLGKKAPAIVRSEDVAPISGVNPEAAAEVAPVVSTEAIDKSIDEMVK